MPKIRPFRGIRFDEAIAGSLSDLVAPPYDVVSKQDEGQLRRRSAYNIVHVDLPDEAAGEGRYEQAGRRYESWLREGVLRQDAEPSIYVLEESYEQGGTVQTVAGLVAAVRLEAPGGAILPHEQTLNGPKADRLALMRATRSALSPVYAIYSEKTGAVRAVLDAALAGHPVAEASDGRGVDYRLFRVADAGDIARLAAVLDGTRLLIADGHHRYETALAYRDERRRQDTSEGRSPAGEEDYDYTLMFLVNVDGTDFTVLPVHRVVKAPGYLNLPAVFSALEPRFGIEPVSRGAAGRSVDHLLERMRAEKGTVFGLYAGHQEPFYLLRLRPDVDAAAVTPGAQSSAWKRLDVSVLHRMILESALRIDPEDVADQKNVAFVKDPAEAMALVDRRAYDLALFLNSMPVEEVQRIATGGETMPQKSTYFWPKPLTGLVIEPLG